MIFHCTAEHGGRLISCGHGQHNSRIIKSWELIFVLTSELKMFVGEDHFIVSAGECLLLPPGIRHGGLSAYSPSLSFFWIHFYPENRKTQDMLNQQPRLFPTAVPERLTEYFQLYLSLQEEKPKDQIALNLVLSLILHEACGNNHIMGRTIGKTLPFLVEKTRNILLLRFREPLSTAQIAAELQCNPDYLGKIYRKYQNETIMDALNRIRLNHAAAMLRDSAMNISQIADETGFHDPGYFRRCFYRRFALSPRAFRHLKRQGHINTE